MEYLESIIGYGILGVIVLGYGVVTFDDFFEADKPWREHKKYYLKMFALYLLRIIVVLAAAILIFYALSAIIGAPTSEEWVPGDTYPY